MTTSSLEEPPRRAQIRRLSRQVRMIVHKINRKHLLSRKPNLRLSKNSRRSNWYKLKKRSKLVLNLKNRPKSLLRQTSKPRPRLRRLHKLQLN